MRGPRIPSDLAKVAFTRAGFKRDPFPTFARMREEAPVLRVPRLAGRTTWLVSRYGDAKTLLSDPRFVKDRRNVSTPGLSRQPWAPKLLQPLQENMNDLDEPAHRRLRGLVKDVFTRGVVEGLTGRIQELADQLLETIAAKGHVELLHDFAVPIPTIIISELLGIPEADCHRFKRWSSAIVSADSSRLGMARALPALFAFVRYLRKLVKNRREDPRDDLVSRLAQAESEGDCLSEDELFAMIFLLIVAGHETTTNLIANGSLALVENPDQLEHLAADPDLAETAIEELLRFAGPLIASTERYPREEVELGGVKIPPGDLVLAVVASANRDPLQFPDADVLNLGRTPNRHLAFGHGIHYCLGAPLARLEARIALGSLAERFPNLRLAVPRKQLRWRPGLFVHALRALPLALDSS